MSFIQELFAKYGIGEDRAMMEKIRAQEQAWQQTVKDREDMILPRDTPPGTTFGVLTETTPPNFNEEEYAFMPQEQMPYQREPTQIITSKEFEEKALPIFEKYNFPKAIGFGQYAGEGRVENGGLGAQRNNFYNLNAVDSNPDQANSFTTPEEGIEAYVRFVTGQASDSFYANGVEQKKFLRQAFEKYQETGDEEQYLRDIQASGYASRKDYPEFVMSTPEWRKWLKG